MGKFDNQKFLVYNSGSFLSGIRLKPVKLLY